MILGAAFDMDGLMFDTERLAVESWQAAGAEEGLDIEPRVVIATCGLDAVNSRKVMLARYGGEFPYERLRARKLQLTFERIDREGLPVKPGLIALLRDLRARGIRTALATSSDEARARKYLTMSDTLSLFDALVCFGMIERGKPEPDIYLRAAREMGLRPEDCLALEDAPMGVLAAFRAGMRVVMVPDLVEPDEATRAMLFACVPSLERVIGLV